MNERIKQLVEQAGLEWKVQPPHYTNTNNPIDFPKSVNIDLEKFAELIVQECTGLLYEEAERLCSYSSECDNVHDSDEAKLCAEKCMDNIKMIEKHFGVE